MKVPEDHLNWLAKLPVFHKDDLRIFVHAGVPIDQQPEEANPDLMQWMLYEYEQAERYKGATYLPDGPHVSGLHIVHGHVQSEKHPLLLPHRTNLDSAAYYSNRLAIGVFDNSQAAPVKIMDALAIQRRKK
jgi:serine/threonine protein phosphatase 1